MKMSGENPGNYQHHDIHSQRTGATHFPTYLRSHQHAKQRPDSRLSRLADKLVWVNTCIKTDMCWWLVWYSANGAVNANKVQLRRAQLVLGLLTTFSGHTIPVFSRPLRPNQHGHPSVGRCWQWFWPPLGKKRQVLCSSKT